MKTLFLVFFLAFAFACTPLKRSFQGEFENSDLKIMVNRSELELTFKDNSVDKIKLAYIDGYNQTERYVKNGKVGVYIVPSLVDNSSDETKFVPYGVRTNSNIFIPEDALIESDRYLDVFIVLNTTSATAIDNDSVNNLLNSLLFLDVKIYDSTVLYFRIDKEDLSLKNELIGENWGKSLMFYAKTHFPFMKNPTLWVIAPTTTESDKIVLKRVSKNN